MSARLPNRLSRRFFNRPPEIVARSLLGKWLIRIVDGDPVGGMIVETEAYLARGDAASHSHRGPTPRNASMFKQPGTLYVYSIHAKYCLNATTQREGVGSAVLIRALEPTWGIEVMRRLRGREEITMLTRGPAMLCQALGIDRSHDAVDLITSPEVMILDAASIRLARVCQRPRIGIRSAAELPLRFFIRDHRMVSGPRREHL